MAVSLIAIVAGVVAFLFVKERPEDLGQTVDGLDEPSLETPARAALITQFDWTPRSAYRTFAYWMIILAGIASKFPLFFVNAHWILHLKGAGISAATAAWSVGIFTLGAIAGRLFGGFLLDKMIARYAFMLGFCCYLIATFLAAQVTSTRVWMAHSSAALFGIGFGWTFVAINTIIGHYYGPGAYPQLNGTMAFLTSVIASPSGAISGKIFDSYGSYVPAFELMAFLSVLSIGALAFAVMPRPAPENVVSMDRSDVAAGIPDS